jgi:hypothetical protein
LKLSTNSLLPPPGRILPPLDSEFRPVAVAERELAMLARNSGAPACVQIAIEQPGGSVCHHSISLLPETHPAAGIDMDPGLALPEKLERVQRLMADGDARARLIYETIGVYLGYAVLQYAATLPEVTA